MDIALPPKYKRMLKKETKKSENPESTDNLWILSIISDVSPDHEDYLLLLHADSLMHIVHKMNKNWKKNIDREIVTAFEYFFDRLRSKEVDLRGYEEELKNINFVSIGTDYANERRFTEELNKKYKSQYKSAPRELRIVWITDQNFEIMQDHIDNSLGPYGEETLFETFKKSLKNYPPVQKEEVSFEENREALTRPEFEFLFSNPDMPIDDKGGVFRLDISNFSVKSPYKKNFRRLEKLSKKIGELSAQVDPKNITLDQRNRMKILQNKINDIVKLVQTEYTGEYKKLEVPSPLPKDMVFEFVATIDLYSHITQRRFTISADATFEDLDYLLSHLFRWGGFPYHLSSFLFPNPKTPESERIVELITYLEEDIPDDPIESPADTAYLENSNPFYKLKPKSIKDTRLSDFFPKHKTAQYRYDFGDNWFHALELVGIYDKNEYDKPLPYLIDSYGTTPPDDIGGVPGYRNFMTMDFDEVDIERFLRFTDLIFEEKEYYLKSPCSLEPIFKER